LYFCASGNISGGGVKKQVQDDDIIEEEVYSSETDKRSYEIK
jgi:hypothetical protein